MSIVVSSTNNKLTPYHKTGPNGDYFDWGQFAIDTFGYDIYSRNPDDTKSELIQKVARLHNLPVIDVKLSKFVPQDYQGIPDFEVQGFRPTGIVAKQLNQTEIDVLDARGAFDVEDM